MKHCVYIIVLLCCGAVHAQHTTQGSDFWVSFGENIDNFSAEDLTFQVRIVTVKATTVTFTFTGLGTSSSTTLAAGSVYTRNLSAAERQAVYSSRTGKSGKSLHIESSEDISVYAINLLAKSTDATAVLPVKSLGTSYYHMSYTTIMGTRDGYTLVATENGTNVYENGTYRTVLNRGEVYSQYFATDITGRHITADKPVAYFTTNSCVNVPAGVLACDCLYEQLFPETAWGTSFMVPPTIRGKERVRVLASKNGTKITHIGGTVVYGSLNLNAGQYVEIEISKTGNKDQYGKSSDGCYIESDNPVAVVSYLTGLEYDNIVYNGDPAMTWIPSIEQSVNELMLAPFVASGSSLLVEHHVLIVTSTEDRNMTEMSIGNSDYAPLSGGSWTDHTSGYSFYSMPLTVADLSYRFRNPGGITVLGYGLGYRESYYYLGGSATRKLNAAFYINGIHYQDLDGKEFCSDKFDIEAVVKYNMHPAAGHMKWVIDGTEEVAAEDLLQWSKTFTEDTHTISMMVRDENDDTDTLTVLFTINIRKIELGDTAICREQSIELKVGNPSDQLTYRWYSDAAFSGFIQQGTPVTAPLTSDTVFYVEAISNIGCSIRDSMKVSIYPVTDLTVEDIDVCNDFTARPKASSANAVLLKWYGDPNYSNLIISADSFETAKLNRDTVFYVEAVSANGCITRDTVKITVYDVRMDDLSVCYDATAVISAPPVDISSLTWYRNPDYSDAITHALSFETAKLKVDTAFYLEALSAKGCLAKNFVKVTVNPLPELITADTSICAETETTFTVAGNAVMLNWYSDAAYYHRVVQALSYTTALSADAVFYVEALSNEGCITRDSIGVSVTQQPSVRAMDDSYLCHGEEITLTVLQSDGLVNWNVGSTKLKPESTREYTVTASRPPCPDVSDNVMITVGDSLHILPPVLPPYTPYANYFVQLTTNAESPDYSIIKGNLPFGLSLGRSGDLSGVPNGDDSVSAFTVQLEDVHNCIVTREYTVERDFYIPRMFTPNGDGINDVFMPGCEVTVFDRLGMEIFKGDNGWDGTYNNKLVSRDIYFYILNRKLENGTIRVYNGYIGVR